MELRGVHHVSLNVHDVAEARDFYCRTLGLSERDDRPDLGFGGAWLDLGDQQLHLLEVADAVAPDGQHVAIAVDDLDGAVTTLRSRGVVVGDPSEIAGICRQAFLRDPTGNLIELNQPL